jgi:hypothetical protein
MISIEILHPSCILDCFRKGGNGKDSIPNPHYCPQRNK